MSLVGGEELEWEEDELLELELFRLNKCIAFSRSTYYNTNPSLTPPHNWILPPPLNTSVAPCPSSYYEILRYTPPGSDVNSYLTPARDASLAPN